MKNFKGVRGNFKKMRNNKNIQKTVCPLCFSENIEEIYRQKNIPIFNNVTYGDPEESKKCNKGEIILKLCNSCGFVFNSYLNKELLKYNKNYDNNRLFSDFYNKYINSIIRKLINNYQIKNKHILEIGCGNGHFLKLLCKESGSAGIGFDLAYKGKKQIGKVSFIDESFGKKYYNIKTEIIILRHTLEHIEKPNNFLSAIINNINSKKELMIIIEVPNFDWILKQRTYWDITYEHCNYFTKGSIKNLFKLKKINLLDIFNSFSGQYLVAIGKFKSISASHNKPSMLNKSYIKDIRNLINNLKIKKNKINSKLGKVKNLTIWGMSGKGVTFINMLDEKIREKIPFMIDINKNKQGRYCPGTDKKIVAPEILKKEKNINDIIIMNPIYCNEISKQLKSYGRRFNLIKI